MAKRFLTLVFACVALAAACPPALANKGQLSIFQDDAVLRGSGNDARTKGLNELDGLGVDVIKVIANWRTLAPGGNNKPAGFDGADPADYSATAWAPFDDLIRDAQARGMRVMLMLGGLAPDWASGSGGIPGSKRPDVGEFRKFVKAVGTRYSGSYTATGTGNVPGPPPPDDPDLPLPLTAQATPPRRAPASRGLTSGPPGTSRTSGTGSRPQHVNGRPYAPHHYRRLVYAADAGLAASGHGRDTFLIGELVPYGAADNRIRPLEFLREMACVNRHYRPFHGKAARKRGCDNFRPLPGTGLAHHPYTLAGGPKVKAEHRDDVPIGYLPRLVKTLNKLGRKNRVKRNKMKIWLTEFGFQTDPPDFFASSIRKVPASWGMSEWLAWRNPRVASYSQYLLKDERDTSGFQTGIRFAGGKAKPGVYNAYRLPFFVRLGHGRKIEVWGGIRAAGAGRQVTIQCAAAASGASSARRRPQSGATSEDLPRLARGQAQVPLQVGWTHQRQAEGHPPLVIEIPPMAADPARLAEARLYFVTDASSEEYALREALAGGVDVLQLREKDAPDEEILAAAATFARRVRRARRALHRQRPARTSPSAAGADGVHVGQDDEPVDRGASSRSARC